VQQNWNIDRALACLCALSDYFLGKVYSSNILKFNAPERQAAGKFRSAASQYGRAIAIDRKLVAEDINNGSIWNEIIGDACERHLQEFADMGDNLCSSDCIIGLKGWLEQECRRLEEDELRCFKFVRVNSAATFCEHACFNFHKACVALGFLPAEMQPVTTLESHESDEARRKWEEQIIAELKAEASAAAREEGIGYQRTAKHGDLSSKILGAAMNYAICLSMERGDENAASIMNRITKTRMNSIGTSEHRLQLLNLLEKEYKTREIADRDVNMSLSAKSPAAHCQSAFTLYSNALQKMRELWEEALIYPHGADELVNVEAPVGDILPPERIEQEKNVLSMLKALEAASSRNERIQSPQGPTSRISAAENPYAKAIALDWLEPMEDVQQKVAGTSFSEISPDVFEKCLSTLENEAKIMTEYELKTHGFVSHRGKAFYCQKAVDELKMVQFGGREE